MPQKTLVSAAGNDDGCRLVWEFVDSCLRSAGALYTGTLLDPNRKYHSAWRFVVPLGSESEIVTARLYLYAAEAGSGTLDATLGCEDVDDADDLLADCIIQDRVMTTANTSWSSFDVSVGRFYTPSFASSLQEVLNRSGWAAGNHVMVMAHIGTGGNSRLHSYAYEEGTSYQPKLVITYRYKHFAGCVI